MSLNLLSVMNGMKARRPLSCRIIAAAFSMLLAGQAAHAASGAWNVDASGSWVTDSNWNPAATPGAAAGITNADLATFSKTLTADRTVDVDANRNIGGITFSNNSTFKFILSGGNMLLTNGGVIQTAAGNGNHTDTISTAITIQGDGGAATFKAGAASATSLLSIAAVTGVSTGANVTTLTLNGTNTGTNTIGGIIGNGAGGGKLALTKSDGGTWVLSGTAANTYSGVTTVSGGTLFLQKTAGVTAIPDNITLGDGTGSDILQLLAGEQIADTSVITLVGTVTIQRGMLRLNGFNETIGGLSSFSAGAGVVENNSGVANSILTLNVASDTQTYSGLVRNFGANGTNTLAIVKSGAGTQVLSGANNTYTGGTTIASGVLSFANGSLGSSGTIAMNGGTLQWNGTNTQDLSARLLFSAATAAVFDTNGNNVTFASAVGNSTTGSLVKSGAGKLTLPAANTYSGNTTISAGTLALSGNGSIANSPNISVAGGATFDVSGLSSGFTLSANQTLNVSAAGATINGTVNCGSSTVSLAFDGTAPATPSFSIPGGGMTLSGSTVIKITTGGAALSPGIYKIIGKAAGGTGVVAGTPPSSVTVVSGSTTYKYAYALSISGGELYLTVPPRDQSLVVMGSSVAQGFGSSSSLTNTNLNGSNVTGYAGLLQSLLIPRGWTMNNISIGGHNTQNGLNRFATDLAPLSPSSKFVWLGYSLANELLHGSANPAGTVATYAANLSNLISQSRSSGFYPVIALNYPRNLYTATEYEYLKSMNLVMNSWDVPSANLLGAIDDGTGNYISGYFYNDTHPNDAGHRELFYTIVPTLFDAINAGKTASPQLAAETRFARLTQNPGVTAPVTFTPADTMHSFTVSFRARSTSSGTVAAIRAGANYNTLEIRGGLVVYHSAGGQEISASVNAASGGWHDVALAYRYALQQTALMVDGTLAGTLTEQYVPDEFTLGGPSASGRPATPDAVDFQNWCVYRSAWNLNEAVAQMQGNRQQASMEICAALDDASFASGSPATNRAQSLSAAVVNTPDLVALQGVPAPGNLSAQPLPGTSAVLAWTLNSTAESGFVIQRRVAGTINWNDVAQLPAGATTHTATGLTPGVSYEYRVAAMEGGLRGNYSNTATVATGLGVHQTILIDFGPNDVTNGVVTASPDSLGQYWNNFVGAGGGVALSAISLGNLTTSKNVATTIGLNSSASGWAANGIVNGGLLTPSYALLGNFAVATATEDYFLTTSSASLTFNNLDPAANYRLRLFGTRDTTETRVTRYTVTGGNGPFTADLTTSGTGIGAGGTNGNNNTIASISSVTPNGSNQIQVAVTKVTGSFAHLGILELMANHSPAAQALSFNATVGQTLTVDVINGTDPPTDADGDGLAVTSVSGALAGGGTAATNGGTGFTYAATVAGTNRFSYTVSDLYGGTATNTVTVTVRNTFESWSSENGIAGAAFGGDFDGDGLSNGIEYAMGSDPRAFTISPALVASGSHAAITFPKGAEAAADPKVVYSIELSYDLSHWTQVAPTAQDNTMLSYTLGGTEPKKFVRLRITRLP